MDVYEVLSLLFLGGTFWSHCAHNLLGVPTIDRNNKRK